MGLRCLYFVCWADSNLPRAGLHFLFLLLSPKLPRWVRDNKVVFGAGQSGTGPVSGSLEGCHPRRLQPCMDLDETWLLLVPGWYPWSVRAGISHGKGGYSYVYSCFLPLSNWRIFKKRDTTLSTFYIPKKMLSKEMKEYFSWKEPRAQTP